MSKRSITTTLQHLRSRLGSRHFPASAQSGIEGIKLQTQKLLWVTPFHHYRLSQEIYTPINCEICKLTQDEYQKFIQLKDYKSDTDAAIINNEFFKYQGAYLRNKTHTLNDDLFVLNGGWNELEQSHSFKQLKEYIYKCILLFFKDSIKSEHELDILISKHLNAYCWISIHLNDSYHPSHTHADSIVSGVYYIRVPSNNSHKISFQDPKGIDLYNPESTFDVRPPPFDNEFEIEPSEGDLILFPSWLPHRVVPPQNPSTQNNIDITNTSRLSLAFNVLGSWKRNVSKHMEL